MSTKLFFKLIRNEIFNEDISAEKEGFSADVLRMLYKLSKAHDVAHLVSDALIKNGLIDANSSVYKFFIKQQQIAVSRYERISYELENLSNIFEKEEIPFIPLKGSVLRGFYPEPWMRTSCDIDILIKEEDLDKATKLLVKKYRYEKTLEWDHDISFMSEGGVHLELHYNFVEYKKRDPKMVERIWESSSLLDGYSYRRCISNEAYYYYHIAHMAKHFESGGCGIRPFLDLEIMQKNIPVDKAELLSLLESTRLKDFYDACVRLCEVWFNDGNHNELTADVEKFILRSGVYGNMENRVAILKSTKSQGRFKYLMYKIFLPYEELSVIYPKLRKRKWLTPLYEIRRWFEIVFCGRMKNAVREIKVNAKTDGEQIKNTTNLIKNLGLETENKKTNEKESTRINVLATEKDIKSDRGSKMYCINNAKNLIQLIRAYLGKSYTLNNVEWENVYHVAKLHSMSTIFYDMIKEREDVPNDVKLLARNSAMAQIRQQVQQDYYEHEIYKKLYENNVKFMPMKASVLRKLYDIPEHRLSCDVDILYDQTREETVNEILKGFEFTKDKEWHNGIVTVEMHKELVSYPTLGYEYFANVWERLKTDDGVRHYFTDEDFYVYFTNHTAKHFYNGGFGIRTVLDIYEFNKAKNYDREYVKKELEKLGLYKFVRQVEELANAWFEEEYTVDESVKDLSDIILMSGVYGIERNSVMVKNVKKNSKNKHTRFKYLFVTLFPPYRTMKTLYPFLKYLPFMLPFMWVYKWFEVLLTRRKSIKKFTGNINAMNEQKVDKFRKVLETTDFPVEKYRY